MGTQALRSDMGWSTADRITVRGLDLCQDVLGQLALGDFAFLEVTGRKPDAAESTVFNAILAVLVEHGMTPSAMVARLTYLGAPESMQAAIAAGLCGMGTTFAGTAEGAARLLQEALPLGTAREYDVAGTAARIVQQHRQQRLPVPGIGHPVHKPVDPRAVRLFAIAEENGLAGPYVALMQAISQEAERAFGKPGQLPVNATGAIGAIASELGLSWKLCRGLAVVSRAVGLLGHLAEEIEHPIANTLWVRTEEEASSHLVPKEPQ
ncbi:citryl-CoA lyase [Cupriavidus nantongensis]|uniref:citrate synthase (unknown stereospecificity) n=1 Tax=Cupriavidus nantongensis TaxID=1796606 RepID=A0A142JVG0_9BURK|nr:citryl-CoA lyase [Cupriavidus nantongensis]AMR82072.1 citryl-CoA lyase [Cupriavidus nantongensis]